MCNKNYLVFRQVSQLLIIYLFYYFALIISEHEIQSESVLRDPWVFLHNPETSTHRLEKFGKAFPGKSKLWMTRCPSYKFERWGTT